LHSKASNKPGGWFTKLIGCPESFTEPKDIYKKLKERGMDYITITDHNTIDGVLEIAHYPEVFISAEYTVFVPEEKTSIHVLVYGIDEHTHEDLMKLRDNVYEFVCYLKSKGIAHSLAHPLYPVNGGRVSLSLVERFVLLFDNWEGINGSRGERLVELEAKIAKAFSGWEKIAQLEEKYNMCALRERPEIAWTAGSDDHSGLYVGKTWTKAKAKSKEEFLKEIKEGRTQVGTDKLGYERLLNTVGVCGYKFLVTKNKIPSQIEPLYECMFKGNNSLFGDFYLKSWFGLSCNGDSLFKEILNRLPSITLQKLRNSFTPDALGLALIGLAAHFIPVVILSAQGRDEVQAKMIAKSLGINSNREFRLAYITDTYFDINGVARSSQTVRKVAEKFNLPIDVIGVGPRSVATNYEEKKLKVLQPILEFSTPYYQEFKLRIPSVISLAELLKDYTAVHVATPGPFGLLAFLVAKLFYLPVTTAFHTDIPSYAYVYTGSEALKEFLYKALSIYHNLSEAVFVPSQTYARILMEQGVKPEKIRIFRRGIDTELFNPNKRERDYFEKTFGFTPKGRVVLYVGRVSKEKNLEVFVEVARHFPEETFIIMGDGPYRAEVERNSPKNVIFLGYLSGETLAKVYANSDIFFFPSETETYGFVVLEAMASGLPVLASKKGGASEHIKDGVNGFLAEDLKEYIGKLSALLLDEELRKTLAKNSLSYVQSLDLEKTYLEYLNMLMGGQRSGTIMSFFKFKREDAGYEASIIPSKWRELLSLNEMCQYVK